MRCLMHPLKEVVGYCVECGSFGCEDCVLEFGNKLYCKKHHAPLERRARNKIKKERQRLVVHVQDGRILHGTSMSLNPNNESFIFNPINEQGGVQEQALQINYTQLKAVFYVRSYDGKFDRSANVEGHREAGRPIVVEFKDGEVLPGFCHNKDYRDAPRFILIPEDPSSNNISVLVERSATVGVFTPEEYMTREQEAIADYIAQYKGVKASREEMTGDFYFKRHNFVQAAGIYEALYKQNHEDEGILTKLNSAQYNLAIGFIRRQQIEKAIHILDAILALNPRHERARRKHDQIFKKIRDLEEA